MTTGQHHEDRFDERLLGELRTLIVSRTEAAPPALNDDRKRAGGWVRRLAFAAIAMGALAVAIAVALPGGSTPAFAISRASDGSVTVTMTSFQDAIGLQQGLQHAGVRAMVQLLPPGKDCSSPLRVTPVPPSELPAFNPAANPTGNPPIQVDGGGQSGQPITVTLSKIPPNATLVIESAPSSPQLQAGRPAGLDVTGVQPATGRGIDLFWSQGTVQPCTAVGSSSAHG